MASRTQILSDMNRVFTDYDPVTIQAAITDFCFNKCFMCDHYKRKDKTYINLNVWIKFLRELKNTKTVFYTGGDSMMHPKINDIMFEHLALDIDFGFITTGYIPESVDMNILNKAKFFNVSLDSLDEINYSKIRGGIELNKVLSSIDYALDCMVSVNATVVISEFNIHEIVDIIMYCYSREMNLRLNNLYSGIIDIEKIAGRYSKLFDEKGLKLSIKNEKFEFEKCVVPYYSMFVDAKGDIYPCCVLGGDTEIKSNSAPLGNISNFEEAKANRLNFYKNKLPSKCSNCLSSFQKINNAHESSPAINLNMKESRNFY